MRRVKRHSLFLTGVLTMLAALFLLAQSSVKGQGATRRQDSAFIFLPFLINGAKDVRLRHRHPRRLHECDPPIPACTIFTWDTGVRPSLALDAAGHPRIAYDANHEQGGPCGTFTDTKLTRFIQFNRP